MVTENGESDALLTRSLISSTGLSGPFILSSLLSRMNPPQPLLPMYYANGSYAAYLGPGASDVRHLIYPVPEVGPKAYGFSSLGTHLTLDLSGSIRFGPDIECIAPPGEDEFTEDEGAIDFRTSHLVAIGSTDTLYVRGYKVLSPKHRAGGIATDYCGIRPKLASSGHGFQDFQIRMDWSCGSRKGGRMISLLGIESPGLTSSLAIAKMVVEETIQ